LPWQRPFDARSLLGFLRIAWPKKPTPRIKQHAASYHTTKVTAHQRPEPVMANCIPKLVAIATSLSTCGLLSNTWFLGPIVAHDLNGISIGSAFMHSSPQSVPVLYSGTPFPLKIAALHWGSGPPSNTWFPRPTLVCNPSGIWMVPAVFVGLTSVTDRPTDHTTRSITIGRIYICSTAMRPNNKMTTYKAQ